MKNFAWPVLLLLVFVSFAHAQPSVDTAVDAFVKAEMERQKIPGVSIAVVKSGKPLIVKGYGLANVEHNVAVKPETIFQSGSVGKQFTAFAVMMLVEEGKIGLDDPLSKYLPEVPESWKPLTIRRLLTHTSGLGDYPNDFNLQKDASEVEIFKELQRTSPTFPQGAKWNYSNVAYVTLGVLIRKVSGQFYGDFLSERVFKPLGMSTTRIISEADIVANRAAGYRLVKGELKNQEWVAPSLNTTADGALYMTALDLIKWDEALRNGKLLKKQSYDEMWSPVKLADGRAHPYGFGWAVIQINGKRLVEHGGSWQGFKTFIARYIDHDLTVIAFANLAQANPEQLARGIAHIVDPSTKPLLITDPDPKFTANIEDLLAAVIEKRADMTRFTPEVQKSLESSGDRIAEFVKTLGPIEKFSLLERSATATATQYRYRVEYSGMSLNLAVAVDRNGKIAGFSLQPE